MPTSRPDRAFAVFGGTFDPIHQAHLACAQYVLTHCAVREVQLMPCHLPAHRASPGVSAQHRAAMVQLAIAPFQGLSLQPLELNKQSPSYTVDSLRLLRDQYPRGGLLFVMGMDSLAYFKQWHQWQSILQLAHLVVCQRPGSTADDGDCPSLLEQYGTTALQDLHLLDSGKIMLLNNPPLDLSATRIRTELEKNQQCAELKQLIPAEVLRYINSERLYSAI
ncbi:nicotinate-nucleotide adenylyltransferase [Rheinheimera sp.]|jgi:nicotinate-nucleotide adenylyltransferase|uniref:nicotinate-nucleotide adenylyltransferase n=1 Tax=Rheinheimera sp. TaxID=1869214 RepID=UPI0026117C82|nr:nicotinate-nucleotide adenylyltransferase [Rheinheimera sp.]MCA1931445.1 nicotinate-nucleotide adenylyltransferase [Rheinheimera sp.]